jgi:DNA-binding beta-propeller fold protein YncE
MRAGAASQIGVQGTEPSLELLLGGPWLTGPTDLAFDPIHSGRLWLVNRHDDSIVMIADLGLPTQTQQKFIDVYHYYAEEVAAVAISRFGTFATCQDSASVLNGTREVGQYVGPTLWPADPAILAAEMDVNRGGAHVDSLSGSPLCTGIAWAGDHRFYVTDGEDGDLDLVDFGRPHGPGFGDPAGAIKYRVLQGVLAPVQGVAGHMALDGDSGWLYIADTGNARVHRVDTTTGVKGKQIFQNNDPGTQYFDLAGVDHEPFVETGLHEPAGLAVAAGYVFVADHATGWIHAFDMHGDLVNSLDTGRGPGALAGIAMSPAGELLFVDTQADEVIRVVP